MRLGTHHIGTGNPPFIIAEIGVNHNGSVDTARRLIDLAASAHADAVKFQYFSADHLLSDSSSLAEYQRSSGATDPASMLRDLEVSLDEIMQLAEYATTCQLLPIVTVFSLEHVTEMKQLPWSAYKVASPDIINKPLLEQLLSHGKPMIVSTGAATADEVQQSITWIQSTASTSVKDRLALMQCISSYPTPTGSAHLAPIAAMRDQFRVPVGYSDHTLDERTGGLAVAAGAALIEKHITYSRDAQGPDHAMSLEPDPFDRYVRFARLAATMLGRQEKVVHAIEHDVRTLSRQSIVATRTLRAGEVIRREDLTIKRPGTGLPPEFLNDLVGLVVAKTIQANQPLMTDHVRLKSGESHRFADRFPAADAA